MLSTDLFRCDASRSSIDLTRPRVHSPQYAKKTTTSTFLHHVGVLARGQGQESWEMLHVLPYRHSHHPPTPMYREEMHSYSQRVVLSLNVLGVLPSCSRVYLQPSLS